MKLPNFDYHRPERVDQATELLAELGEDARIIAGGQSLLPMMAFRLAAPEHLIDINNVLELRTLDEAAEHLTIGAGVRHAGLEASAVSGPLGDLLREVARNIAHLPVRTRGTFCGSLAHADPASEWCAVIATLDGVLLALSRDRGAREIHADAFFDSAMTTNLEPDEVLVGARLPILPRDCRWGFYEFALRAGDFALAMAVALLRLENGRIIEARLGLGGAEDRPRRLTAVEEMLCGEMPSTALYAEAAETAAQVVDPMIGGDIDADYRRDIVGAVVKRALARATQ